jgi:integrase
VEDELRKHEKARRIGGVKAIRDGVWRVDVEVPRLSGGPRRRRSRTVAGTREDAENCLALMVAEFRAPDSGSPKETVERSEQTYRKSGSGGITKLGEHRWLVGVDGPNDPVTNKRRRYTRTVHGARRDAEVVLARLRLDLGTPRASVATNARTVSGACALYLAEARTERTTVRTDRSASNRICQTPLASGGSFGDIPLSALDWKTIEFVYAQWARDGLQAQAQARYASTLSKVLEHAKRTGWALTNPAVDAKRPRVPSHRPDVPSHAEVRLALNAAKTNDFMLYAYVMGLATIGCRRSELLALRVADIDLHAKVVVIRAALADGGPGTGVYYKTTKRNDWRDVPLTDQMCEVFNELLDTRQRAGRGHIVLDANSYVFSDSVDGSTWLRPDTTSQRWLTARGNSGVTFAMLRRFVATQLLDATSGDYRTVASITGNSEETLRRWYDAGPNLEKKRAVIGLGRL